MDISSYCKEIDAITAVARHLNNPVQVIKSMIGIVEVCKKVVDLAVTVENEQKELDL